MRRLRLSREAKDIGIAVLAVIVVFIIVVAVVLKIDEDRKTMLVSNDAVLYQKMQRMVEEAKGRERRITDIEIKLDIQRDMIIGIGEELIKLKEGE